MLNPSTEAGIRDRSCVRLLLNWRVNSAHFYTPELPLCPEDPYLAVFSSTHQPPLQGLRIPPRSFSNSPGAPGELHRHPKDDQGSHWGAVGCMPLGLCSETLVSCSSVQEEEGSTRWQQHLADALVRKPARVAVFMPVFLRGPLAVVSCVLSAHSISPASPCPSGLIFIFLGKGGQLVSEEGYNHWLQMK